MIIKKPYAFLIRHFKLIHFILFLSMLYINIKTLQVFSFFANYLNAGAEFIRYGTPITTLGIFLYISIFVCFAINAIIIYLFTIKNKGKLSYIIICLVYFILLILFLYLSTVLDTLQTKMIAKDTLRVIKDVIFIALIPQFILLLIVFSRSLGFNVKQFEFQQDIAQIQIESNDNEEIELTFGKSNYKILRELRKSIRLANYFIQEHKFIVTLVVSIFLIGLFSIMFFRNKVTNVQYKEKQNINVNSILYNVDSSYITNLDISGNVLNKEKYYVIVKIKIKNNKGINYDPTSDNFTLKVNDQRIIPVYSFKTEFIDIAQPLMQSSIARETDAYYAVIFEIDKEYVDDNYRFIIKNTANVQENDIIVNIYPKNSNEEIQKETFNMNALADFTQTSIGNYKLKIKNYKIQKSFEEKYKYCLNENNCITNTLIVKTNNYKNIDMGVIKLEGEFKNNNESYLNGFISDIGEFINYFGFIKYKVNNITKTVKLKKINIRQQLENGAYFEIPFEMSAATNIELYINIRGDIYTFILK